MTEGITQKVFDKFTDDFYSILTTYVEAISPNIEIEEQEQIVDDVIRKISKFYSKH